jgi:hypothetical protein
MAILDEGQGGQRAPLASTQLLGDSDLTKLLDRADHSASAAFKVIGTQSL